MLSIQSQHCFACDFVQDAKKLLSLPPGREGNPGNLVAPVGRQEATFYQVGSILRNLADLDLGGAASKARKDGSIQVAKLYTEPCVKIIKLVTDRRDPGGLRPSSELPMAKWAASQDHIAVEEQTPETHVPLSTGFWARNPTIIEEPSPIASNPSPLVVPLATGVGISPISGPPQAPLSPSVPPSVCVAGHALPSQQRQAPSSSNGHPCIVAALAPSSGSPQAPPTSVVAPTPSIDPPVQKYPFYSSSKACLWEEQRIEEREVNIDPNTAISPK